MTNIVTPTYVDAISEYYPNVIVQALGDGSVYEDLVNIGTNAIPDKSTLDEKVLSLARLRVWREIQIERDSRREGGVHVGAYWFHSDDTSRIQHIALVMFGANMPAGIMWKTLSGAFVEMTPTLASQIFQSIAAQDVSLFAIAEQHRSSVNSSATPLEYDWTTGWTQTYEEFVAA